MRILLLIGTGGFIGSVLRYLFSQFTQGFASHFFENRHISLFPFGTLGVNIVGCFVIGLVVAMAERGNLNVEWRLFLATGICGGFTTFSAFSNDTLTLLRGGQMVEGFAYIAASVILGLAATFVGIAVIKMF